MRNWRVSRSECVYLENFHLPLARFRLVKSEILLGKAGPPHMLMLTNFPREFTGRAKSLQEGPALLGGLGRF